MPHHDGSTQKWLLEKMEHTRPYKLLMQTLGMCVCGLVSLIQIDLDCQYIR